VRASSSAVGGTGWTSQTHRMANASRTLPKLDRLKGRLTALLASDCYVAVLYICARIRLTAPALRRCAVPDAAAVEC
jgi:hypothetical protein